MGDDVPLNERMAVAESQIASLGVAIGEIRDAVVGIRATLDHVARLDERIGTASDSIRDLRRALEAERANRQTADSALSDRLSAVEQTIPRHDQQLSTSSAWWLAIGTGLVMMAAGYFAGVAL